MTIDDKIEIPEQIPLFIKGYETNGNYEPTWFYFIGVQEGYKGIPSYPIYNSELSGSTYSYMSIIEGKLK